MKDQNKQLVLKFYPNAVSAVLNKRHCINVDPLDQTFGEQLRQATLTANVIEKNAWAKAVEFFVRPILDMGEVEFFGLRTKVSVAVSHFDELRLTFDEALFVTKLRDMQLYNLAKISQTEKDRLDAILEKYK